MSFAAAYLVLALAVAVAAALRWPMVGVCSLLAIDFLRPQDLHFVLGELRPAVWLTAATALGSLLRRPRSGWRGLPRTLAPLAAVLAAAALSAATSELPAVSWSAWAALAKAAIVVALIVMHVDSPRRLEAALWTIAGAVAVIAVAAIAKGLALGYPHSFRISLGGIGGPDGVDGGGPMRDNNAFARVLVFTLPLWFALFLRARSAWARVVAVAGGMATLFAFMMTFSRGGLVAAMAIAVLGLLQIRPRWIAIAVVVAAIAVGVPLTPKIWRDRMAGTTLQDRSLLLRFETWREGLRMAAERPLLGVGIGTFTATYARAMPPPPRSAHNVFVEVLAEMGMVGLAAYGWLLGTALWPLWRLSTTGGAGVSWRPLARGLLIGTIGYLVASTALSHAFTSHLMTALALSLGFDPGRAPGGSRGCSGQCIGRAAPAHRGGRMKSTFDAADSGSPQETARPPERRGLLGHTVVYGIAQLATAAASIALLPIYTRALAPRDFGAVAVLELCMTVVASLAGASVGSAATRLHFRAQDPHSVHRVWTTGLIAILAQCLLVVVLGWLARQPLAAALFGADLADGVAMIGPMLALTVVNLITGFAFAYLRALERSMLFLVVTASGLALRIALNLWLLVALRLGVVGYLASGVLAGGVQAAVLLVLLFASRPLRFERRIWRELGSFAGPIAIAALASLAMHQADLWILRFKLGDLGQIGLYAFAYAMVQRSNGLLLTPFSSIWSARLYEVDLGPRRLEAYHRAFRGYTLVSALALLALALCARPLVALVAAATYRPAAELVPILAAGFFLFSLHGFFVVPALLAGRSGAIAWNAVAAAAVDVVLCLVLVPVDGIRGAAVASVAAYGVYSLGGWLRYRRLENLRYPLGHLAKLAAIAGLAWMTRPSPPPDAPLWLALVIAGAWALLAAGVAVLWCGRDLVLPFFAARTASAPGAAPEALVEGTVASEEVDAVEAFLG